MLIHTLYCFLITNYLYPTQQHHFSIEHNLYSVAKTHRMPKVAGHVSPKGPFGAKEPLIIGLFLPQREMTYEDKEAPYASTPACTHSRICSPLTSLLHGHLRYFCSCRGLAVQMLCVIVNRNSLCSLVGNLGRSG